MDTAVRMARYTSRPAGIVRLHFCMVLSPGRCMASINGGLRLCSPVWGSVQDLYVLGAGTVHPWECLAYCL